jgi:hypothetical protein
MSDAGDLNNKSTAAVFDNSILIDPLQRQRQQQQSNGRKGQEAIYSEHNRSFTPHNCLNHHPYGTFYYNKKSGRSGRQHMSARPVPTPRVPNSPTLNSHHHTVVAGGLELEDQVVPNGPTVIRENNVAVISSNFRYCFNF